MIFRYFDQDSPSFLHIAFSDQVCWPVYLIYPHPDGVYITTFDLAVLPMTLQISTY